MNGDPFTRTEGITPEMRKTLRVVTAENGWFVASFTTSFEDELLAETTKIPVYPEQIEGRWQLARIAAPWEEDLEQLNSPLDAPKAVDESSPAKFVRDFLSKLRHTICGYGRRCARASQTIARKISDKIPAKGLR